MTATEGVLEQGTRCLLAFDGRRGPLLVPMAYWYDGTALWMTTAADTVKVRVLAQRGDCAVYVPGRAGADGVVASGAARVLSVRDPLGLLLRAGVITGAIAGLALHNPATLLGYAQDAVRVPVRWAPQNRVVLRVALSGVSLAPRGEPPPGVAPPLPTTVPADIRRALAGLRGVAVAYRTRGGVEVAPAWWDGYFQLTDAATSTPFHARGPVSVALDADPQSSPLGVRGVVLHGLCRDDGVLVPERATFWRGFDIESVAAGPARTGVVLPD